MRPRRQQRCAVQPADARSCERGRSVRPCGVRIIGGCSRSRCGIAASPAASLGKSMRLEDAEADHTRRHPPVMPSARASTAHRYRLTPAWNLMNQSLELRLWIGIRTSDVGCNEQYGAHCPHSKMHTGPPASSRMRLGVSEFSWTVPLYVRVGPRCADINGTHAHGQDKCPGRASLPDTDRSYETWG